MKTGILLSLTKPGLLSEADAHLSHARALQAHATPRNKAHLDASRQVLEGRWHLAGRTWDVLLQEHPRDALALRTRTRTRTALAG